MFYFPAFSASYRFESPTRWVDGLKLRAAVGTSGNQPRYGDRDVLLNALGIVGGQNAVGTPTQLGNPEVRPERMTEQEYGLDASFLKQRIAVEATHFDRAISDLLLAAPLSPTSGLGTRVINGGRLRTDGWELSLTGAPVDTRRLRWSSTVTWYTFKSVIEKSAVPPFNVPNSGFGAEYGRARWVEGYRSTLIWGNRKRADGTTVDSVIADAAPDYTMGFVNQVTAGPLSLNVVVDYREGGYVSNMTQSTYDDGKNSYDYDQPAPGGDPRPLGLWRSQQRTGGNTTVYIQDGSYVKLREIVLAWQVPARWARAIPRASSVQVSVAGRNLRTWSPYWGLDPEVSNFGNQNISRFVDLTIYPPSKSFFLSVDVGF
jgi:outer membrane receptor protein involved in Fe transport